MTDDFYDKIGTILRTSLDNDEDPFKSHDRHHGTYRKAAGKMERRPPPKIDTSIKRVATPPELSEDFAVLKLLPGMPLDECKQAWKRLIKTYHPDVAKQNESAAVIRRINHAYKRIKTWFETGSLIDPFRP